MFRVGQKNAEPHVVITAAAQWDVCEDMEQLARCAHSTLSQELDVNRAANGQLIAGDRSGALTFNFSW